MPRTRRTLAGLACAASVAAAPAASAHVVGYLELPGLKGPVAEGEHAGWIDVSTFSWEHDGDPKNPALAGYGVPAPARGGGTLIVTRPADRPVAALAGQCTAPQAIPTVTFSHPRESLPRVMQSPHIRDLQPAFLTYRLTNVRVAKCLRVPGAEGQVMWLHFDDIAWLNASPPKAGGAN